MKINVCVNGSFRYPDYIRHYDEAGVLNTFYCAHHRRATGPRMGVHRARAENLWWKQYALRAVFHAAPQAASPALSTALCDLWQRAVIRHWRPCDSVETVIGAVADRIIPFARAQGSKVLGHPVTAHPDTVERLVGDSYRSLGLDPRRARVPDRERRVEEIALCDALIADSHAVADSYIASGVPASRIAVVRPGLDLDRFRPRRPDDIDRDTFLVVCVGIVTPRKAQHLLLQAWTRLKLPRAHLLLVGALGRDAAAVLHGHEGRFTHLRHVDHATLRALLVRASAFVMPSAEDGFGQAPFEAMACGVPTIVTETVGMADAIRDGSTGFVVPPFDPDAIAAAIEVLHRDPDRGAAIGQAGAASVHAGGGWSRYAEEVIAGHRRLVGAADRDRSAA